MTLTTLPKSDVIEVSVFGTGRGESLALHLCGGDWAVVDSCVDRQTGEVAVLSYLKSIGVDPAEDVKLVVATHAHDDHIEGMAETVEVCVAADFVCTAAATQEEFFALLQVDEELETRGFRPSAFREFRRINEILVNRAPHGAPAYKHAVADRRLYTRASSQGLPSVAIDALSPSDEAITRSRQTLAGWFPQLGDRPRRMASDPNTTSVSLWVEIDEITILLGSDLLIGPGPGCGWNAVLASASLPTPTKKASVFKVPHHGSAGADHPDVWNKLLLPNVMAALTPFWPGRNPLPSKDDERRICARTMSTYVAASSRPPTQPRAIGTVAGSLAGVARTVRGVRGKVGQIRLRLGLSDSHPKWAVSLDPPAQRLCKTPKNDRRKKRRG